MQIYQPHPWPLTVEEAITIQEELRHQVITQDQFTQPVQYVAGVDMGFEADGTISRAAVAVLSFPDLQVVETSLAYRPTSFPYIPGFLSFREIPAVLDALEKIQTKPDIILCDGQGIAHPRRLGIASHLGVLLNIPTIGVAKSLLIGRHEELADTKGSWQPLIHRGEIIGAVLRTRVGVKPVYVSSGHKISLPTAIDYVLRCTPKYRLPETTRVADKLASNR
ncbi:Endonuclease V [Trichormus variabilis ATCC 29413]|uniref:Endonuclease V n=2 Tax=Anabaena variabilis TaxID=264691 RepID=NFI_TRIV2|nr:MULTISPECIES: deoxyribonuclease V [Nostocaceae]Q3MEZ3.1 RecName: Full=Endonuclease V; AltName: Full=Deoxyinosine 3'endonuclease; AltName: Full=Deoxyribonuclease V; Short=DNase V [Trichormus variabilis ATCC 29413]ABA20443.1 Endonuclease V [Trichormus variabilis ATCC 29413]MBC1217105.1 deoxyribonuclease V [Trichormus variabilis ARAD]MBC1256676.1 deoxyribonuclease V [Trichormus variabilis V5]MBC1269117.1 deoxyribonuclease V [Trichormus variabilis FSR]MBC1304496.1 deoxyribonuclease V [Trichorm